MALLAWSGMTVMAAGPPAGFTIQNSGTLTTTVSSNVGAASGTSVEPSYAVVVSIGTYQASTTGDHRRCGLVIDAPSRFFAGFHHLKSVIGNYYGHLLSVMSGGNIVLWAGEESLNPNGDVIIRAGDDTGTEIARIPNILQPVWKYMELEVSTTTLRVRIDSVVVVDIAISIPAPDQLMLGAGIYGNDNRFDNFYLCDDSGGSYNTFLGPVVIRHVNPQSPIVATGWTSFTGGTPSANHLTGIVAPAGYTAGVATDGAPGNSLQVSLKPNATITDPVALKMLLTYENLGLGDAAYDVYLTPDSEPESLTPEALFISPPGPGADGKAVYNRDGVPISTFTTMTARIVASI